MYHAIIVISNAICPLTVVASIGPSPLVLFQRLAWADDSPSIAGDHILASRLMVLLSRVHVRDWELIILVIQSPTGRYHQFAFFTRATHPLIRWLVAGHGESELLWDGLDRARCKAVSKAVAVGSRFTLRGYSWWLLIYIALSVHICISFM